LAQNGRFVLASRGDILGQTFPQEICMSATLVLTNGRFHTMDPAFPLAPAIAIRRDTILAVGDNDSMKALLAPGGEWVDLDGRAATPGLVDAHVHFQGYALHLQRVDLTGTTSLADALQRIQAHCARQQTGQPTNHSTRWLQGRGWAQDDWTDRAFPTAVALDSVCPDQPACLHDKSGHAAWVNSRALRLAGLDAATPDPPGGHLQRDADGRLTGILFEDAIDLVTRHIPPPTPEEIAAAMQTAQQQCWQLGLTGIHDFDGRACFQALQHLHQNGQLGLRVLKNIPVYRLDHAIGVGLRSGFGDDWLRLGGVKIFADGALGPRTAAMLAPYENDPDNRGIVVTDKEEMHAYASRASAAGLSVTVHAIGDRANHDILDVYAAVRQEEAARAVPGALRHRIEHVQLLHPDDRHRLAQLGIIASMQPIHATSDMVMADSYWGARARYSYAWRTMLDSGATLVFGSDAPVETIAPLPGLHAAVTRRRPNGAPGPAGWYPEQRLSLPEAVHAYTFAAAVTSGQTARQGSLTPGKLADLTIFDRDIFTISPDQLLEAGIAATLVGGEFKFRRLG